MGALTDGTVQGDEVLLFEAFASLLSTAADATAGEAGRVDVECTTSREGVVVRIRDDGPGMRPDDLKRALENGSPGQPSSARALAFAFVRDVIDVHGARLEVASEGAGTTITVTFPAPSRASAKRR